MSNAKTVVLVRTRLSSPDPTQVAYQWAKSVKKNFETSGRQVLDLAVNDAVRAETEVLLRRCENSVFLFYGHGLPD